MSDYQSRFKGNAIDTATNAVRKAVGGTAADNYDNNNTALIRGDTEASGSTTDNEILQADGSNKNKLKGSGISIDSIKKLKAGVTSKGYIMLSDLPGYNITEDIVLKAEGSGSNKAVILYFGRNFFDSTSTNNSFDAFKSLGFSNLVGTRNVSAAVGSGNKVFAADTSSASFVFTSALDGTFLGSVKAMDLEDNHEYLVIASFTLQEGSTLAPSAFNFYSGTSTSVIATAAPTGSSGVFYAVLKPSITSASGRINTGKFAILDANATADAADTLDSLMIIDLTLLCDDSYNKTAAQAYAKYYTNTYWEGSATAYSQLIAGTTLHATNLIGPRYIDAATGNWFIPYTRNWFAWVPSGTKLYIQEFQANNSNTGYAASHYIKTIVLNGSSNSMGSAGVSIGGGYAYKIALDQGVTLNAGTVAFYYGKAADDGQPTPPSQTYSAAPLMQYIPDANLNDAPGTLYNLFAGSSYWVPHWQGVNLKPDGTGVFLTNNSIFDSSYSGWNSASEVTFNFRDLLIGLGLTQTDLNKEGVAGIGALSYQQNGSNFTFSSGLTNPNHTFVSYVINSVNNGILDVDNKVNALMQKNLISTLPTAVGTYKYEVTTEGEEGRWSKEEETVLRAEYDKDQKQFETWDQKLDPFADAGNSPFHWRNFNIAVSVNTQLDANGEKIVVIKNLGGGIECVQVPGSNKETVPGHKFLVTCELKCEVADIRARHEIIIYTGIQGEPYHTYYGDLSTAIPASNEYTRWASICSIAVSGDGLAAISAWGFSVTECPNQQQVYARNIMCFDLTNMFGAGNEPATVTEFLKLYPAAVYKQNNFTLNIPIIS